MEEALNVVRSRPKPKAKDPWAPLGNATPRRATPPPHSADAACPDCFGTGLLVDREGLARPCACGIWKRIEFERRLAEADIPPKFRSKTFDTFTASTPKHREVRDFARAYAEGFDPAHKDANGLLLRGRTGCGKTHIAVAIARTVLERGFSVRFVNFQALLARLKESYADSTGEGEAAILESLEHADLVAIDDLGAEMTTDWVRDRLYLIVNRRYEADLPIIVTTNCNEAELDQRIGPRSASRFYEMCRDGFIGFPDTDWRRAQMK